MIKVKTFNLPFKWLGDLKTSKEVLAKEIAINADRAEYLPLKSVNNDTHFYIEESDPIIFFDFDGVPQSKHSLFSETLESLGFSAMYTTLSGTGYRAIIAPPSLKDRADFVHTLARIIYTKVGVACDIAASKRRGVMLGGTNYVEFRNPDFTYLISIYREYQKKNHKSIHDIQKRPIPHQDNVILERMVEMVGELEASNYPEGSGLAGEWLKHAGRLKATGAPNGFEAFLKCCTCTENAARKAWEKANEAPIGAFFKRAKELGVTMDKAKQSLG